MRATCAVTCVLLMKEILKGRHIDGIQDIKGNMMTALMALPENKFQNCLEGWTRCRCWCTASQGEYFKGDCRGTRKTADCTVNEGQPTCTHCIDGKEYTEKNNYLDNCRRCDSCDKGHGLEVEKNCTQTQNTKCKCKENYFCNSTPCDTCEPCTTCEHGIVEKCTLTSNTKCKEKGSNAIFWWLPCVLLIIIAVGIWGWCKYKKCNRNPSGHSEPTEKESLNDTEVDLSRYIPYIAEIMKLTEVKEFVRKNDIQESKLDEITNNHPQDTAEQKVQLLINWYQNHGKKGAYNTLISSVPKGIAEKIRDQIKKDINNDDKDADFKNENERQSLV